MTAPACRRWLFATARPSTSTSSRSHSSCTSPRRPTGQQCDGPVDALTVERGRHHDRLASSRGRRRLRRRGRRAQRAHDEQDRPDRDARVRDVEHRPPADRDEVDDVTAQEPGRPRDAIDEVAERAAEHERQADRASQRSVACRTARDEHERRRRSAPTASIGVMPWKRPNALPRLRVSSQLDRRSR